MSAISTRRWHRNGPGRDNSDRRFVVRVATVGALATAVILTLSGCDIGAQTSTATATNTACATGFDNVTCSADRLEDAWGKAEEEHAASDPWSAANVMIYLGIFLIGTGVVLTVTGRAEARRTPPVHLASGVLQSGAVAQHGTAFRAFGAIIAVVGAVILGGRFFAEQGVLASLLIGVPIALVAAYRIRVASRVAAGYGLADAAWQDAMLHAQLNPVTPHDPYADLRSRGVNVPAAPQPVVQPVPEPEITPEEARDLAEQAAAQAAHEAETGGWNPQPGSALAVLTSVDGKIGPACTAVDRVGRDLKWGRVVTGEAGEQVWDPHVAVDGVHGTDGGDAEVSLRVTHASIDEATIRKHLPALLRALKVRSGEVSRDVESGQLVLTVTNRKEAPAAEESGPQLDPDWS